MGQKLYSCFKKVESFLYFILKSFCIVLVGSLIFAQNNTFASTYLEGVKLENGYVMDHYHYDTAGYRYDEDLGGGEAPDVCPGFVLIILGDVNYVQDRYFNRTYSQDGSVEYCSRFTGSYNVRMWDDSCRLCTYSTSEDTNFNCSTGKAEELSMFTGFVTERNCYICSQHWMCKNSYEHCGIEPPSYDPSYSTKEASSSYTLKLDCQGEKIAKTLHIEANVVITAGAQLTGREFLINGHSAKDIFYPNSGYDQCSNVYTWGGWSTWDVPISGTYGDSVTITPSTTGYGYANISLIKVIFESGACEDKDGDGHYAISANCPQGDDCDDNDPLVYPDNGECCPVPHLTSLTDPLAIRMENGEKVIYGGLTTAMQQSVDCFSDEVFNTGGTLNITSAYRPPQYQQHLQEVWNRYRDLFDEDNPVVPECDTLREQIAEEFQRHGLREHARPGDPSRSRHTAGNAIDANVTLPAGQDVDTLANGCDLYRPYPREPWHLELRR